MKTKVKKKLKPHVPVRLSLVNSGAAGASTLVEKVRAMRNGEG